MTTMTTIKEMRGRIVSITPQMLGQLCRTQVAKTISIEGVPDGSQFLYAYFDMGTRSFKCVFTHESFEACPDGVQFPSQRITFIEHKHGPERRSRERRITAGPAFDEAGPILRRADRRKEGAE